jgi:hypothetical protein
MRELDLQSKLGLAFFLFSTTILNTSSYSYDIPPQNTLALGLLETIINVTKEWSRPQNQKTIVGVCLHSETSRVQCSIAAQTCHVYTIPS